MTDTMIPAFGRGGQEAVETSEEMAPKGGGFRKTYYLPEIGKDNKIVLRYLTDSGSFFYANAHPQVPTKPQPAGWTGNWPKAMSAVCRYDKAFKGDPDKGIPPIYTDCYVDDANLMDQWGNKMKPKLRVWAVAALRQEVVATQDHVNAGYAKPEQVGTVIGYTDVMREVEVPKKDEKGDFVKDAAGNLVMEKVQEIALVIVNKAVNNYFGGLQSLYGMFKTVCDRDYAVIQRNETRSKDVEFQHVPLDVTPSLKPGSEAWARYDKAREEQGLTDADIIKMLAERASDEFYAKFIDPTKVWTKPTSEGTSGQAAAASPSATLQVPDGVTPAVQPADQAAAATAPATPAVSPTNDVDPDRLAQMKARLSAQKPAPSEPEAAPEAAPAAAAPSAPAAGLSLPD